MRILLTFLSIIIITNVCAQNIEVWEDPYEKPGAPGFEETYKAYQYQITNDNINARLWYEKGAQKGNLYAYCILANMMINGIGGPKDIKTGLDYYISAANLGFAPAKFELGKLYMSGEIVPKNLELAFGFIKSCVEVDINYRPGKRALGMCYIEGMGTSVNIQKGVELLESAALSGDSQSQLILGDLYHTFIEWRDDKKAIRWYLMASNNSIWQAQNTLALMYAKGEGVDVDFKKAHEYISLARTSASIGINNSELLSKTLAELLDTEGEIYLLEGKNDEAYTIWNLLKSKYYDYVDTNKYNVSNTFTRRMYKEEEEVNNNNLASSDTKKNIAFVSDIDENIPENSISGNPIFAVIIANENYKEVESVSYGIRDGEAFKQYCKKTLGIPQNNIHFLKDATLNNMKRELNWISQVIDVYQGEAKIIFYYVGHGIPDESNGSAYLLPIDGYGSDITTGISLDNMYEELSKKPAKSVVVLLDACFSGAKRDGGMLASSRGVAIKAKQNTPSGNMMVFSASQGDETAYPYKEKGHGLFTYYLLKKLQQTKGDVTLGELANFVITEVKKQSVVINGKMQTPLVVPSINASDWESWNLR